MRSALGLRREDTAKVSELQGLNPSWPQKTVSFPAGETAVSAVTVVNEYSPDQSMGLLKVPSERVVQQTAPTPVVLTMPQAVCCPTASELHAPPEEGNSWLKL